ncbi:transposase [Kitasatospora sp. NPDC088548]|uniref:transposase n=1 Tax=Kitasatospora sp. NPDC088548 TaxID=3364075 RepID=UPI00382C490F
MTWSWEYLPNPEHVTAGAPADFLAAVEHRANELARAAAALYLDGTSYQGSGEPMRYLYTDPGKPRIAWNDEQARADLVDALVRDALNLLGRLPERQLDEKAADAVGLLALVAGQDMEITDGSDRRDGRWRTARGTVHDRVVSTVDPEARHTHKNRTRYQDDFRAHGAFEPETGLLTEVELTAGTGAENHEAAVARTLLADGTGDLTVLGDTAYGTGDLRETLETDGRTLIIKPPPPRPAVPGGFTADDFHADTAKGEVTCPAGHTWTLAPAAT